jgi:uncharacterized protein YuzE
MLSADSERSHAFQSFHHEQALETRSQAEGQDPVTELLLQYDESVDAAYLTVSDRPWHHQERLDDGRGIDYAADGSVIGIELLSPRRKGVVLDGLPYADDVRRVLRSVGFRILETAT